VWASWYQKGKTNLDFTGARDSEWQWHQLGRMQVCISLQTDNHASTPPSFFTGRMPFLSPNQHCQSTDGITYNNERNSLRVPEFHHLMLLNSNTFKAIWICLWQVFCADIARNKTFLGDYITQ